MKKTNPEAPRHLQGSVAWQSTRLANHSYCMADCECTVFATWNMVEAVVGLLRHSKRKRAESARGQSRERRKLSKSPPHLRRRRRASAKAEKVVCATTSTSERREPPRWRPRGSEEGGVAGRVGAALVCAIWNPRAGLDLKSDLRINLETKRSVWTKALTNNGEIIKKKPEIERNPGTGTDVPGMPCKQHRGRYVVHFEILDPIRKKGSTTNFTQNGLIPPRSISRPHVHGTCTCIHCLSAISIFPKKSWTFEYLQ